MPAGLRKLPPAGGNLKKQHGRHENVTSVLFFANSMDGTIHADDLAENRYIFDNDRIHR